jgi:hypothetical protein
MSDAEQTATQKTFRAIGRFIYEFSQVEYTIRVYLAEEIRLSDEHFHAVALSNSRSARSSFMPMPTPPKQQNRNDAVNRADTPSLRAGLTRS